MTVLYQTEITKVETSGWYYAIGILLLITFLVLIFMVFYRKNWQKFIIPAFVVGVLCAPWIPIGHAIFDKTVHTGRYQYECLINDRAAFTDIYEDYNVIEQRGDLWILEDK